MLAKEQASGAAQSTALTQAVSLARSLAATNAQLRDAFDKVAEQRDELEAAHGLLLVENTSQRERLGLLELTLAMESYPSAPHDSMQARVEAQLRAAAQEVVALRNENASLKDQMAMHPSLADGPSLSSGGAPSRVAAGPGAFPRRGAGGGGRGRGAGGGKSDLGLPEYGGRPAAADTPPAAMTPLSLSSTGGLLLSSAWMPPPPTASAGGNGNSAAKGPTIPRLMPAATSAVDEVDQLSVLLRKRAELAQSRPSTANTFARLR